MTAPVPTPADVPGLRAAARILRRIANDARVEQPTDLTRYLCLTDAADRLDADAKRARGGKRATDARASVLRGAQQLRAVAQVGTTRQGDLLGGA